MNDLIEYSYCKSELNCDQLKKKIFRNFKLQVYRIYHISPTIIHILYIILVHANWLAFLFIYCVLLSSSSSMYIARASLCNLSRIYWRTFQSLYLLKQRRVLHRNANGLYMLRITHRRDMKQTIASDVNRKFSETCNKIKLYIQYRARVFMHLNSRT